MWSSILGCKHTLSNAHPLTTATARSNAPGNQPFQVPPLSTLPVSPYTVNIRLFVSCQQSSSVSRRSRLKIQPQSDLSYYAQQLVYYMYTEICSTLYIKTQGSSCSLPRLFLNLYIYSVYERNVDLLLGDWKLKVECSCFW